MRRWLFGEDDEDTDEDEGEALDALLPALGDLVRAEGAVSACSSTAAELGAEAMAGTTGGVKPLRTAVTEDLRNV